MFCQILIKHTPKSQHPSTLSEYFTIYPDCSIRVYQSYNAFPYFLLIFTSKKVAQSIILKSVLVKNLMWAFTMYFLKLSFFFSKIHAGAG